MGRCEEQQVPVKENDVSDPTDYDEIVLDALQEVHQGLGIIEQIVAMLPQGYEIIINFDEIDDSQQEGVMLFPNEESYMDDDLYPENLETARQMQLKSGLVNEDQSNYNWSYEELDSIEDHDFPNDVEDEVRTAGLFPLEHFRLSRELYYEDPLALEEIDYEIVELEEMMREELFGGRLEGDQTDDDGPIKYCNELNE